MQLAAARRMRSSVLAIVVVTGCGEPLHAPNYACSEEVACQEALVTVTCAGAIAYALCEGELVPILDPLLLSQITSNACYDVQVTAAVDTTTTPQPTPPPPVRNVWVRFADGVRIRPGSPGSPTTVDPGTRPQVPWAPTRSFTVHGTKAAPTTASPSTSPPAPTYHPPVVDTATPSHPTTATTFSHPSSSGSPAVSHPSPPASHPAPPTSHPTSNPAPTVSHPTSSTTSHSASSASSHSTASTSSSSTTSHSTPSTTSSTPAPSHTSPTSSTPSPAKHR